MDGHSLFSEGRVIGYYRDSPIYDFIYICGARYEYAGLSISHAGALNPADLKSNEAFVEPGLLYRRAWN